MNTMTATSEITRHAQVSEWTSVCEVSDLAPDTGVCAMANEGIALPDVKRHADPQM